MKHARIQLDGQVHQAIVEADQQLRLADGRRVQADQVTWLPPATGSMFALGLNYCLLPGLNDSREDAATNERIIAEITRLVWNSLYVPPKK